MANILLLEPNTVLANTYVKALEQAGHTVACCISAQQALEVFDECTPGLVIAELQLTGHDGIEFLHEMRSYPDGLMLPVIVNTNVPPQTLHPLQEVLERDLGVRTCLYKPQTSLRRLLKAVGDSLGV